MGELSVSLMGGAGGVVALLAVAIVAALLRGHRDRRRVQDRLDSLDFEALYERGQGDR